jgi:Putative adhesin
MENIMRLFALLAIAVGLCYAQRTEGSFERTLSLTGFADLELTTDAGGIDVVPGPPGTIRIRGILKAEDNWFRRREDVESHIRELEAHPPIVQNGNSVQVEVRDRSLLRGISMRLEVETPPDSRLRAHTDSGGIHASEIESEVRATADSGGIHIRRVNGPVYAHADSGGIDAMEISGSIDAEVDSGGVRVSQTAPAPIKARSDSGGADITLARTGGYDIQAHASSGQIRASEITVSGRISPHEVYGKLRGGGALVDVRTDSGHIDIR